MSGTVGSVTVADTVELWPVHDAVFGDHASYDEWRAEVWDRHVAREGFRLARARRPDGELVGFAYGYTGRHGQWWTDHVAASLGPALAQEWLGGHFELVSIGVLPSARGAGVGGQLLEAICAGLHQERWLLTTTADEADPARRLYAAHGWSVVGPGIGEGTVVLGRRNPTLR